MEQRLSIITLTVSDLAASRAFYRDVFGWSEVEPAAEQIAFFQLAGIQFALYPARAMSQKTTRLLEMKSSVVQTRKEGRNRRDRRM